MNGWRPSSGPACAGSRERSGGQVARPESSVRRSRCRPEAGRSGIGRQSSTGRTGQRRGRRRPGSCRSGSGRPQNLCRSLRRVKCPWASPCGGAGFLTCLPADADGRGGSVFRTATPTVAFVPGQDKRSVEAPMQAEFDPAKSQLRFSCGTVPQGPACRSHLWARNRRGPFPQGKGDAPNTVRPGSCSQRNTAADAGEDASEDDSEGCRIGRLAGEWQSTDERDRREGRGVMAAARREAREETGGRNRRSVKRHASPVAGERGPQVPFRSATCGFNFSRWASNSASLARPRK